MKKPELEAFRQRLINEPGSKALDEVFDAVDNKEPWVIQLLFYCIHQDNKEMESLIS